MVADVDEGNKENQISEMEARVKELEDELAMERNRGMDGCFWRGGMVLNYLLHELSLYRSFVVVVFVVVVVIVVYFFVYFVVVVVALVLNWRTRACFIGSE